MGESAALLPPTSAAGYSGDLQDLVSPGAWRRFVETFQRFLDNLRSQKEPDPAQLARLTSVGLTAGTDFCPTDSHHLIALESLWRSLHGGVDAPHDEAPGSPHPLLCQEKWKQFGFQNANPASDFRGAGVLGAHNIIYFANTFPAALYRCLHGRNQTTETPSATRAGATASARVAPDVSDVPPGVPADKIALWQAAGPIRATTGMQRYPFAVAALNVTMLLLGILDLPGSQAASHRSCMKNAFEASPTADAARERLVALLAAEVALAATPFRATRGTSEDEVRAAERAFADVFCVAMRVLDELWDRGVCSYNVSYFNTQLLPALRARLDVIFRAATSISHMRNSLVAAYGL